jgi:hypothetical protein
MAPSEREAIDPPKSMEVGPLLLVPCRKLQPTSHVDPVAVQHPVFTHGLKPRSKSVDPTFGWRNPELASNPNKKNTLVYKTPLWSTPVVPLS